MKLATKRFGNIEVHDDNVLEVPTGIPGFPELRRVTLLAATGVEPTMTLFWMQDLDDGDLAFLCLVPWATFPEYDFEFEAFELGIADEGDVRILNLITIRRDESDATMSVNLRAPLIVDVRNQRLHQVILSDSRWPVSAVLGTAVHAEVS